MFHKPGQELKYVGAESTHTPAKLCAILNGVLKIVTKLTSWMDGYDKTLMSEIYRDHAKASHLVGLAPTLFLIFRDL